MVVEERRNVERGATEAASADEATIQFLADRIRMDGYCVLEDAIPLDLVEQLRERFDQLLEARIRADGPNRGANRYQMFLPWEPPFTDPRLIENPRVMPILERVMGQDANHSNCVVRVSIVMEVKVGSNDIRLSGSAAPRRNFTYQ